MQLAKYEHACFVVEKDGCHLIVDPGEFTTDLTIPESVSVVVITHQHPDHFDTTLLDEIIDDNPQLIILAPAGVTRQLKGYETKTVKGGDSVVIGGFELDFYGDTHATIVPGGDSIDNIGVLIEDRIYYGGDALVVPEKSVDTLAIPAAAPWLKVSETIEFLKAISPRFVFPTHDAILSGSGKSIYDHWLAAAADEVGARYQRLDEQTIDID